MKYVYSMFQISRHLIYVFFIIIVVYLFRTDCPRTKQQRDPVIVPVFYTTFPRKFIETANSTAINNNISMRTDLRYHGSNNDSILLNIRKQKVSNQHYSTINPTPWRIIGGALTVPVLAKNVGCHQDNLILKNIRCFLYEIFTFPFHFLQ